MSRDALGPVSFPCGAIAKNRIALAPLTNLQSQADGMLGPDEHRWLARRARGGFGIIETCAAYVSADGKAWPGQLGVHTDRHVNALRELGDEILNQGAIALVQLFHGGERADPEISGHPRWTAWPDAERMPDTAAGSEADVLRVIDDFRDAAVRIAEAGWSGVELHGAHGYLLCQFLAATNRRDDGWGGDLTGRARLLRRVVQAVRDAVPPDFIVGVRLSPENYARFEGLDLDESVTTARWLCEDGADFIHLSLWDTFAMTRKRPDQHPLSVFREALPGTVPIVACGKLWSRSDVDRALELGADIVAGGRSAILNPEWPQLLADPEREVRVPPTTAEHLSWADVSPVFVGYLRRWKGLVADDPDAV